MVLMKSALIIVALGANVSSACGNPQKTLEIALNLINQRGVDVKSVSSWWRTPAFPTESGADFVNAVASVSSDLAPADLLQTLHAVEIELGRTREKRWEPRICDLDLIAYGETIEPDIDELKRLMALGLIAIDEPPPDLLVLPHPRMHERGFVLAPMAEIAPDWRHPVLGKTTAEMLADLPPEHLEGMSQI